MHGAVVGADEQPHEVMAEANALDVCRLRAAPAEREGAHVQVPREELCVCQRRGACICEEVGTPRLLAARCGLARADDSGQGVGVGVGLGLWGGGRGVRVVASVSGGVTPGVGEWWHLSSCRRWPLFG